MNFIFAFLTLLAVAAASDSSLQEKQSSSFLISLGNELMRSVIKGKTETTELIMNMSLGLMEQKRILGYALLHLATNPASTAYQSQMDDALEAEMELIERSFDKLMKIAGDDGIASRALQKAYLECAVHGNIAVAGRLINLSKKGKFMLPVPEMVLELAALHAQFAFIQFIAHHFNVKSIPKAALNRILAAACVSRNDAVVAMIIQLFHEQSFERDIVFELWNEMLQEERNGWQDDDRSFKFQLAIKYPMIFDAGADDVEHQRLMEMINRQRREIIDILDSDEELDDRVMLRDELRPMMRMEQIPEFIFLLLVMYLLSG